MNVSRLKSGDREYVRKDIAEVVNATPGVEHKVILETCYLNQEEKRTACQLVVEAGADYVKTSTGFGAAGATVEDVRLMKEAVAGRAKVKASGGIRDWKTTLAMLEAGGIGSAPAQVSRSWPSGNCSDNLAPSPHSEGRSPKAEGLGSKFRTLQPSVFRPPHPSRVSRKSRQSRLSRATPPYPMRLASVIVRP
jgi:hypothetical protein